MCQPNFSMAFWVHRACAFFCPWIVVTVSVRGDSLRYLYIYISLSLNHYSPVVSIYMYIYMYMVRPSRLGRHPELVAAVEAMQLHEAKVHRLSVECRTCPGRARSSADPRMLRRVRGLYPADPYVEHARFTTERSDGDPVCGEVWRLWQMQRHGQHHVASGAGSRSPSERQRRGSKRCDSADRRLLGANLSRCREDGCGAAEDPPSGVFTNRTLPSHSRGRAFAPLADQRWVANTLSYIKELDTIATKRSDVTGKPSNKEGKPDSQADPKKAPKKTARPWKKKNQGGSDAGGAREVKCIAVRSLPFAIERQPACAQLTMMVANQNQIFGNNKSLHIFNDTKLDRYYN